MKKFATLIGAGLAAGSLMFAGTALAEGSGAGGAAGPGGSGGHSQITAENPMVNPAAIIREHQPPAIQTNAGRQANGAQGNSYWGSLLSGPAALGAAIAETTGVGGAGFFNGAGLAADARSVLGE